MAYFMRGCLAMLHNSGLSQGCRYHAVASLRNAESKRNRAPGVHVQVSVYLVSYWARVVYSMMPEPQCTFFEVSNDMWVERYSGLTSYWSLQSAEWPHTVVQKRSLLFWEPRCARG